MTLLTMALRDVTSGPSVQQYERCGKINISANRLQLYSLWQWSIFTL